MPTLLQYAGKVVSLLGQKDNRNYAFILSKDEVLCAGAHLGEAAATYQTALVNAMQNNLPLFKKKDAVWALCTYKPSDMCIGMAGVAGVELTAYWNGADVQFSRIKNGISPTKLNNLTPSLPLECAVKLPFAWDANQTQALAQAKNPALFNEAARKLTTALESKAALANTTRLKESSAIEAALSDIPKSDPPGAGFAEADADLVYANLVYGMVGQTWNPTAQNIDKSTLSGGEKLMGNNIAGILLDDKFQIVAWALNFAGENVTFHAETLMLQYFLRQKGLQKLPANYKIYSSLQPCDMCGSFILHVGNNTEAVYCTPDATLKTVLTASKTVATERQVRLADQTAADLALAAKRMGANKATSALLADPEDQKYRSYMLANKGKVLSAPTMKRTDDLVKGASPFNYTKDKVGELDSSKSRLGFEFVKSADKVLDWAETSTNEKIKKAAKQGLEVFEALLTRGFTTAYGLKITNKLFDVIYERNKPKPVVTPVAVVGVVGK